MAVVVEAILDVEIFAIATETYGIATENATVTFEIFVMDLRLFAAISTATGIGVAATANSTLEKLASDLVAVAPAPLRLPVTFEI